MGIEYERLVASFEADTSSLEKAGKHAIAIADEVETRYKNLRLSFSPDSGNTEQIISRALGRAQSDIDKFVKSTEQSFNHIPGVVSGVFNKIIDAEQRSAAVREEIEKKYVNLTEAEQKKLTAATISEIEKRVKAEESAMNKAAKKSPSSVSSPSNAVGNSSNYFNDVVSGTFLGAGAANLTVRAISQITSEISSLIGTIKEAGIESVKLAADFEETRNALEIGAGSARLANQELAAIDETARNTKGLRLQSAEEGYTRLRNLGFAADTSRKLIAGIGTNRLISRADEASIDRVIVNLTQLSAGSSRASQDIREIIQAIPSLKGVFEDAFGTSDRKKIGQMFSDNPDEAVAKFAEAMANAKQPAIGLNIAVDKLTDAGIGMGRELGSPLLEGLTNQVENATDLINDNAETWRKWGQTVADSASGAELVIKEFYNSKFNTGGDGQSKGFNILTDLQILTKIGEAQREYAEQLKQNHTTTSLNADNVTRLPGKTGFESAFLRKDFTIDSQSSAESLAAVDAENKKLERLQENQRQKLVANLKDQKEEELSITRNYYKILEAQASSHLDFTLAQQLETAKKTAKIRQQSFDEEINKTFQYYADLFKFGELSADEEIKATRDMNKEIGKLNTERAQNEISLQKEIQQKEHQIIEQRRQAAIEFNNLRIREVSQNLAEQSNLIQNDFQKLIQVTNDAYVQTSKLARENFDKQLENESLSAEQRVNIEKQKYLELQNLANQNSQNIQKIETEQFNKSVNLFAQESERIISAYKFRVDSFKSLQNSFFANSISFGDGFRGFGKDAVDDTKIYIGLLNQINSVLGGQTSIYQVQQTLLDKTHLVQTEGLEREIRLNNDLIELEKVRLKGQKRSEITDLETRSTELLELRARALANVNENSQDAPNQKNVVKNYEIIYNSVIERIKQARTELSNLENTSADKLTDPAIEKLKGTIVQLETAKKELGLSQAGENKDLYANSTDGLKELYALIASGQKDNVVKDIAENNLWKEKVSLATEVKLLKESISKTSETKSLEIEKAKLQDIIALRQLETQKIIEGNRSMSYRLQVMAAQLPSFGTAVKNSFSGAIEGISSGLANAITQWDGTFKGFLKGIGNAFAQTAQQIINELIRILIYKAIMQLIGSFAGGGGGGGLGPATGGLLGPAGGNIGIPGHATGAMIPATNGGQLIRVAEGGFPEVVLTTDPKHKDRTAKLLGMFIEQTNYIPKFAEGGFIGGGMQGAGIYSPSMSGLNLSGEDARNRLSGNGISGQPIINQTINQTIHAPRGTVARKSQRQIAESAFSGANRAMKGNHG
jgi:hypothetical protein